MIKDPDDWGGTGRRMAREILVSPEGYAFFSGNIIYLDDETCAYCGVNFQCDEHGCCVACGAPRDE